MGNFRRGLQNVTIKWLEADQSLKDAEESKVDVDKKRVDISGTDLEKEVKGVITLLMKKFGNNITKTNGSSNSEDSKEENVIRDTIKKIMDEKEEEEEESDIGKKVKLIKEKLNNRDKWETPEWRAMGSIYY